MGKACKKNVPSGRSCKNKEGIFCGMADGETSKKARNKTDSSSRRMMKQKSAPINVWSPCESNRREQSFANDDNAKSSLIVNYR